MCGIIAYKGKEDGRKVVLQGLKKLEYRGYDSWGIAGDDGKIWVHKKTGTVQQEEYGKPSTTVIGHTRWATHGGVTDENAHPHLSSHGRVAVVHNGILDNYKELRKELGIEFKSETDTEVIPNLIEKNLDKGFYAAFRAALGRIKGTYAIAAMCEGKIAFARKNSPLIIGMGKDKCIIASDTAPFNGVDQVVYLEDGENGYFDDRLHLFDENGREIHKQVQEFNAEERKVDKEGYPYFMLKEIYEQPETIIKAREQPHISKAREILQAREVYLIACGTSYAACIAGEHYLSSIGVKATAVLASEYHAKKPFFEGAAAIIVSQSGETADLIEVVRQFPGKKIGIINVPDSTLWRMSDIVLPMNSGVEVAVASTKAYTSTLSILSELAEKQKIGTGCLQKWDEQIKRIVDKFDSRDLFIIGRQEAFAYALESAIKIKEISYTRAEALPGGELKHHTLALIERGTPTVVIATPETRQEIINNGIEIKARGGKIIGIDSEPHDSYDEFVECPDPRLAVIPMQLFAYHLAVKKGYDPDKPRNLAKSVTVK
ncbi:glutamine--fructose-6-phosphate transaminase (isomerizing) [Candidatus Woesearchaeota archaeon]|nr:glutamine--fructose-6-phosphate transaminase (isomerizing) [Candidatus Woesearchaeota archaeon]